MTLKQRILEEWEWIMELRGLKAKIIRREDIIQDNNSSITYWTEEATEHTEEPPCDTSM